MVPTKDKHRKDEVTYVSIRKNNGKRGYGELHLRLRMRMHLRLRMRSILPAVLLLAGEAGMPGIVP
jgi:hypothetical protein